MSFFNPSTSSSLAGANTVAEKDIEVSDPPSDSISSLAFSPTADYLAVGSWDNNVGQLASFDSSQALSTVLLLGSYLRSRRERADPRQSHVSPPRASIECMLEQGKSSLYYALLSVKQ